MRREKILVIGACGQIGTDLTLTLRRIYGDADIYAADLRSGSEQLMQTGPFVYVNALDKAELSRLISIHQITQVYLLAAMLSAAGEKQPERAWDLNMQSLLHVLDIARQEKLKVFWPSSIAVFGATSPKMDCPQKTIIEPETVYGISKYAGECWCNWYQQRFGADIRSLRYPGLISHLSAPGGGTTDYAADIFSAALQQGYYTCYLQADTKLPMMYMPDAIRATMELMEADASKITVTSYNITAMSFTPAALAEAVRKYIPDFTIQYQPDYRQRIAETWPQSINDRQAREDWNWKSAYTIELMTADMISKLKKSTNANLSNTRNS